MSYFDEVFRDMERFQRRIMDDMQREMAGIEEAVRSGRLQGSWDVRPIEEPGVKGYVAQGRFWSREPWTLPRQALDEVREPLTDVFQDGDSVQVYVELPGVEKDDIQLNVTAGKAEIRAKNFHKAVELPTRNVDPEKATASYRNGVLKVRIPKRKEKAAEEEGKRKIEIE